jgi:hypothetical protein
MKFGENELLQKPQEEQNLLEEKKQEEDSLSVQMLQNYAPSELSEDRIKTITEQNFNVSEQARAEKVRHRLMAKQRNMFDEFPKIQEPAGSVPVFKPYGNMSYIKRKKLEKRRAANLAKAKKLNVPNATEDTLPLMQDIQKHSELKKVEVEDWEGLSREKPDLNLFAPVPYKEGHDTTIDVQVVLSRIDEIQSALDSFKNADEKEKTTEISARFIVLENMQKQMKATLTAVLAVNGVDIDGAPITSEKKDRETLLQEKNDAITAYKNMVKGKESLIFEEYQKLMKEPLQQLIEERLEVDKKENPEGAELPFVLSHYLSAQSYKKIKDAFDKFPHKYEKNKEPLDKAYAEYLDLLKVSSERGRAASAFTLRPAIPFHRYDDVKLEGRFASSLFPEEMKKNITDRMGSLECIILYFLTGQKMSRDDHILLEASFGYKTDERREQIEEHTKKTTAENKAFDKYQSERKKIEAFTSPAKREMALYLHDRLRDISPTIDYMDQKMSQWEKMNPGKKAGSDSWFDFRQIHNLITGFKTDKNGEPINAEEEQKQKAEMALIDDFFSGVPERRVKHLEKACDELLGLKITEEMTKPEYIEKNLKELQRISSKLHVFNEEPFMALLKEHNFEKADKLKKEFDLRFAFMSAISYYTKAQGLDDHASVGCSVVINYIQKDELNVPEEELKSREKDIFRNNFIMFNSFIDDSKSCVNKLADTGKKELTAVRDRNKALDAERLRMTKKVKFENPKAKEAALYLFDKQREINNSLDYYNRRMVEWKKDNKEQTPTFDNRLMLNMLQGYKTNSDGLPLNEEENQKRLEDIRLVDDFFSPDTARREKWIDKWLDECSRFEITEEMVDEKYILDNYAKMDRFKKIATEFTTNRFNQEYFTKYPEKAKQRDKISLLPSYLLTFVSSAFRKNGIMYGTSQKVISVENADSVLIEKKNKKGELVFDKKMIDFFADQLDGDAKTTLDAIRVKKQFERSEAERKRMENNVQFTSPQQKEMALYLFDQSVEINNSMEYVAQRHKQWKDNPRNTGEIDFDVRLFYKVLQGYKADHNGEPINDVERARFMADQEIIDDFFSIDKEDRNKHIDKWLDTCLNFTVTEDKLTEDYIVKNYKEIDEYARKIHAFSSTGYNADYFKKFPEKKALYDGMDSTKFQYQMLIQAFFTKHGIVYGNISEKGSVLLEKTDSKGNFLGFNTEMMEKSGSDMFVSAAEVIKASLSSGQSSVDVHEILDKVDNKKKEVKSEVN